MQGGMRGQEGEIDMRQREKIIEMLKQPGVKQRVLEDLQNRGLPSHTPCLKIEIKGFSGQHFALEQEDVLQVFSVFGDVSSVRVLECVALVMFKEVTAAYFAQRTLDGKAVPHMEATLCVSWYHNQDSAPAETIQQVKIPPLLDITHKKVVERDSIQTNAKYTCRFDIQIDNEKEFQVARRLIGPKGCNMKKIVDVCSKGMHCQAHDIVKLRLRGKGSGFKEGPHKAESDEPLHMCISSKYFDKYQLACNQVEKLIHKVYGEYNEFCRTAGMPAPNLQMKKYESVSGRPGTLISQDRLKELEASETLSDNDVEELIDIRNEARRQCNFAEADRIREILRKKGITLVDEKGARGKGTEVTTWRFFRE